MSKIVEEFRRKTEECFEKINGFSAAELEQMIKEDIEVFFAGNDIDVEIVDVVLTGSRCRGLEREESDVDFVMEYKSSGWREDTLFDLLCDEFLFSNLKVDINPITESKSGTLEDYLPAVEKYLEEKSVKRDKELLKRVDENRVSAGSPFILGKGMVSFPAEYDDIFTDKELKRVEKLILDSFKLKDKKKNLEEQIKEASLSYTNPTKEQKEKGPEFSL